MSTGHLHPLINSINLLSTAILKGDHMSKPKPCATGHVKDLSLITVSFGSENHLLLIREELLSLHNHGAQVIIVSNSGSMSHADMFSDFDCIDALGNVGFARGCNLGAAHVHPTTKYILFFNPDALITTEIAFSLVDCIRNFDQYGVVVPTSSRVQQPVQDTTVVNYLEGVKDRRTRNIGACFVIPRQLFVDIGKFDENIFLWWEDTDIRDRILAEGKPIGRATGIFLVHHGGHATDSYSELLTKAAICSSAYFKLKWQGVVSYYIWLSGMILVNIIRTLRGLPGEKAWGHPMGKVKFGLYLAKHFLSSRQQVSFDGKGFAWNPQFGDDVLREYKEHRANADLNKSELASRESKQ